MVDELEVCVFKMGIVLCRIVCNPVSHMGEKRGQSVNLNLCKRPMTGDETHEFPTIGVYFVVHH